MNVKLQSCGLLPALRLRSLDIGITASSSAASAAAVAVAVVVATSAFNQDAASGVLAYHDQSSAHITRLATGTRSKTAASYVRRPTYDLLASAALRGRLDDDVSQLRSPAPSRLLVNLAPAANVRVLHDMVRLFELRIGTTWYFTEDEETSKGTNG